MFSGLLALITTAIAEYEKTLEHLNPVTSVYGYLSVTATLGL